MLNSLNVGFSSPPSLSPRGAPLSSPTRFDTLSIEDISTRTDWSRTSILNARH
jgi:hypothetical protein